MTFRQLLILTSFLLQGLYTFGQDITGPALLEKSIQYHDPSGQWSTFKGTLELTETRPGSADRKTTIELNNHRDCFRMDQLRGEDRIVRIADHGKCRHELNGKKEISQAKKEEHRLTCERTRTMKNYYTYLWGLPMKLRDEGTVVHDEVTTAAFQGKSFLRMKVTYEAAVGNDTWYFYFDPATYALSGYRFYHDENKNDGEYITLEGETRVKDMRLPKTRKWYYNKNDEFLGADILEN